MTGLPVRGYLGHQGTRRAEICISRDYWVRGAWEKWFWSIQELLDSLGMLRDGGILLKRLWSGTTLCRVRVWQDNSIDRYTSVSRAILLSNSRLPAIIQTCWKCGVSPQMLMWVCGRICTQTCRCKFTLWGNSKWFVLDSVRGLAWWNETVLYVWNITSEFGFWRLRMFGKGWLHIYILALFQAKGWHC